MSEPTDHSQNLYELSSSEDEIIQYKELHPDEIPEEGSLGLLALGYEGIMLWRQKVYGKPMLQKLPS